MKQATKKRLKDLEARVKYLEEDHRHKIQVLFDRTNSLGLRLLQSSSEIDYIETELQSEQKTQAA